LSNRSQARAHVCGSFYVIKSDYRDVFRHTKTVITNGPYRSDGRNIVKANQRGKGSLQRQTQKRCISNPAPPWENGYCESLNSKLRDEFLNGEIFYSLKEVQVLAERWRVYYNTKRPHSSLGYRPPAPAAWQVETKTG
jgi:hypothetical protein